MRTLEVCQFKFKNSLKVLKLLIENMSEHEEILSIPILNEEENILKIYRKVTNSIERESKTRIINQC